MHKGVKKTIKITAITLTALILLTFGAVAFVINVIFTPEKLTPIVRDIAVKNIDAKVELQSVELTFFSTFPNFGLEVNNASIAPSWAPKKLVSLEKAVIVVNPIAFLKNNEVVVKRVELYKPNIYLYVDSTGRSSLDCFGTSTDTTATDTTESKFSASIDISKITISEGEITVDDRRNSFYSSLEGLNMELRGSLSDINSALMLNFSTSNIILWQKGELIASKIALSTVADIRYNRDSALLVVNDSKLDINGLELGMKGSIRRDTTAGITYINLGAGLHTPSLEGILAMIPTAIIKNNEKIKTAGSVTLRAFVKGQYGKEQLPELSADLKIENASASYTSMSWGIERVDADINLFVDMMKKKPSYLHINNFVFKAGKGSVDIALKASADRLYQDPRLRFDLRSNINFGAIVKIFPLQAGVSFSGTNSSKLSGAVTLSQIKRSDWGRLILNGNSNFKDLNLLVDGRKLPQSDSSYLYMTMKSGEFAFGSNVKSTTVETGSKDNLRAAFNFSGLGFRDNRGHEVSLKNISAKIDSKIARDSNVIVPLIGSFSIGGVNFEATDTLKINLVSSKLDININPLKENPAQAVIELLLQSDSLSASSPLNRSSLSMILAGIQAKAIAPRNRGEHWNFDGSVGFKGLDVYSYLFPLPIKMPATKLTFSGQKIRLNGAALQVGNSDMLATGSVNNLLGTMFAVNNSGLSGELSLNSRVMDLNQILEAMAHSSANLIASDSTDAAKTTSTNTQTVSNAVSDSSALQIVVLPKNLTFNFNLNVSKLYLGKLTLSDVVGRINIKDGAARLTNFDIKALGANMHTFVSYRAGNSKSASVGLELSVKDIDVGRLGEFMPIIDSVAPMLKSFNGHVNFDIVAKGELGENMEFDISKLSSVMTISGDSLVLMDSKTFAKISKMLMFKNKQNNSIDSLAINIITDNGKIDVPPFEVEIDRYRAIIGGTQTLDPKTFDMNFRYNVSIIKSPLPIKAGVDIFGNFDNFDFKITKAKLKKTDFEQQNINIQQRINNLKRSL